MRLTDEQVERYSRQIVLAEVGAEGQMRLGESRVGMIGRGIAAERVVAYLAAAGVGCVAADPALQAVTDPALPGLRLASLQSVANERCDAVVIAAPTPAAAAVDLATWYPSRGATFWIADGRAGGCPPCPRCGAAGSETHAVDPELAALRDALLGTVVATEVVKTLLRIGTPFGGRVLAYDPATATIITTAVTARPDCECRNPRR